MHKAPFQVYMTAIHRNIAATASLEVVNTGAFNDVSTVIAFHSVFNNLFLQTDPFQGQEPKSRLGSCPDSFLYHGQQDKVDNEQGGRHP